MATQSEIINTFSLMNVSIKPTGGANMPVSCPLAPFLHRAGTDDAKSAGVKPGEPSLFRCFACNTASSLSSVAYKYAEFTKDWRAYEYIRGIENKVATKDRVFGGGKHRKFEHVNRSLKLETKKEEITEEKLLEYRKHLPKYAHERGMSIADMNFYEIGMDHERNRMVIPIRDQCGKLVAFTRRDTTGQQKPKYLHSYGFKKESYLYGEYFVDKKNFQGMGCEGPFDLFNLRKLGLRNVVANQGSSYSDVQIDKICRWFTVFIFAPDLDPAGLRCAEITSHKLVLKGVRSGILGVRQNPVYKERLVQGEWHDSDYKTIGIPELMGKDPGEWDLGMLKLAFENIYWMKI